MRQRTPRMRTASTNGPIFPPRYLGAPTMVDALVKDEDEDVDKDAAEAHPVSLPDMDTPSCQSRQLGYQGVHGTSGRRRRILCSTTPGTTYPAPPYSNLTKKFVNWNMCYSCGFDIPDGHTSQTCQQYLRKPDHDIYFRPAECAALHQPGVQLCNEEP